MHNKIRLGLIGGGPRSFIGPVHRIAAYMVEEFDLTGGVFDVDFEHSLSFAKALELDSNRCYKDLDAFITGESKLPEDTRIEVVVILTPNYLHFEMAKKLIEGGFDIICEKPVTVYASEAEELSLLTQKHGTKFCLTHTYTGYPMVRQMKSMIEEGKLGRIQKVDAQYYQGWINPFIHDSEKRKQVWRLDPAVAGQSCCMGDIGVHAFNLIEYTTGLKVQKVLSDLETLYDDNPLDVDGTVLIRMENGAKGVVRSSQIASGEENNIIISVYGKDGGLKWAQEDPTYLHYLPEGEPAQVLKPGNPYNSEFAMDSTKIPPGHPEGLFDAMGNIYKGFSKAIRGESYFNGAFPGIEDGVRGMRFIEAVLRSNAEGQAWVEI